MHPRIAFIGLGNVKTFRLKFPVGAVKIRGLLACLLLFSCTNPNGMKNRETELESWEQQDLLAPSEGRLTGIAFGKTNLWWWAPMAWSFLPRMERNGGKSATLFTQVCDKYFTTPVGTIREGPPDHS